MSCFLHKHKKIKYETMNDETKYKNEPVKNKIPQQIEQSTTAELNFRESVNKSSREKLATLKFKETLNDVDARNYATFQRLKRKLENIKNFYPDVYYSEESVIEMWAKQNELNKINLEILDYDRDSWLWI